MKKKPGGKCLVLLCSEPRFLSHYACGDWFLTHLWKNTSLSSVFRHYSFLSLFFMVIRHECFFFSISHCSVQISQRDPYPVEEKVKHTSPVYCDKMKEEGQPTTAYGSGKIFCRKGNAG